MVRQQRLIAVYKGDELLATGTVDQLATHFNVARETIFHWGTPTSAKRNKGGKKKIAVYLDDSRLPLRQHQTLISLCELYEKKKCPISPIEIGVVIDAQDPSFASPIPKILRRFLGLGLVEREVISTRRVVYRPTEKGKEYVDEHAEDLLEDALSC